ncbi:MAG: DUF4258 domain-containing protein [Cyanobacteria bacterium J06628_6]
MQEVKFSLHAIEKLKALQRELPITRESVIQTITQPDSLQVLEEDKRLAQKQLTDKLLLQVVYREFTAFILTITVYPGRRSRYEKN